MTKRGQTSRAGLRHWTDASCKVARRRTRERTREREGEQENEKSGRMERSIHLPKWLIIRSTFNSGTS